MFAGLFISAQHKLHYSPSVNIARWNDSCLRQRSCSSLADGIIKQKNEFSFSAIVSVVI